MSALHLSLDQILGEPPVAGKLPDAIRWHPDGRAVTYLQPEGSGGQSLWFLDLQTGETTRRLGEEAWASLGDRPALAEYRWLPDGALLLTATGDRAGRLWLAEPEDFAAPRMLTATTDADVEPVASPDGTQLAYIRGGDLYVLDLARTRERQLTADGSETILNGKLDWVTWEELSHRGGYRAFEWSPNGRWIALLRMDQGRVPTYPLVDARGVHPRMRVQHYPKAGDPTAQATLLILDAGTGEILSRHAFGEGEIAVPGLTWRGDEVVFSRLTRDQRTLTWLRLLPRGEAREFWRESDAHWVNTLGPAVALEDGSLLIVSDRDGTARLYRFWGNLEQVTPLTPEEFQVDEVLHAGGGVAWVSTIGPDPRERHLARVALDGSGAELETEVEGVHRIIWSPYATQALVTCSGPDQPPVTKLWSLERELPFPGSEETWRDYDWPEVRWETVTAPDGTLLHGRLMLPLGFDAGRRYPLIVHVYGGPHAQRVRKHWPGEDALDQWLARHGFLVWSLDNRGSWGRGHAFETPVDRHLGEQELADQLAGVEWLRTLPFVDVDRLGITGWSYGGYMTLQALVHAPEVWRAGVAGAPVTDWRLYDNLYTERYMGTPAENPEGYHRASPLHHVESLRAPLLLIHGVDDDNVHLQHTLQLVEQLARCEKPYELILQPGEKHGFRRRESRRYHYLRLLEFFQRHLGQEGACDVHHA